MSIDLITDLPLSQGYDTILTIVNQDCLKAAKFLPYKKTIDREGVAWLYMQHLLPWFGLPKCIISNRDPRFTSQFSQAMCKGTGIQQNLSMAFHLHTDSQTERMNAWIEQYLCSWTNGQQDNWATLLPIAEFTHNSWKHETLGKSPHKLILGYNPTVHINLPKDENVPVAIDRLTSLEEARRHAQYMMEK
jgi:hypothetical protein